MSENILTELSTEEQKFLETIDEYDPSGNGPQNGGLSQEEEMLNAMRAKIVKSIEYFQDNSGTLLQEDKKDDWKPMSEDQLKDFAGQFLCYDSDTLDLSKFDFQIHDEDFYRLKFPNFPDEFYSVMAEASQTKLSDKRNKSFVRIEKETTLSFS